MEVVTTGLAVARWLLGAGARGQPEGPDVVGVFSYTDATGVYASEQSQEKRYDDAEDHVKRWSEVAEKKSADEGNNEKDTQSPDNADDPLCHPLAFHAHSCLCVASASRRFCR